jgi:hypothetical protein
LLRVRAAEADIEPRLAPRRHLWPGTRRAKPVYRERRQGKMHLHHQFTDPTVGEYFARPAKANYSTGRFMQLTLFHLFYMIVVFGGGIIGAQSGFRLIGYPGGAVGGVLGVTLGCHVTYGFHRCLNFLMERSVRRKSTPALKAQLVDNITPGTYVSSLIISVLLERHEPVESFRDYILRQLRSESVTWRKAGLCNLGICYPDVASKLKDFDPLHPTKEDLKRLNEIESATLSPNA